MRLRCRTDGTPVLTRGYGMADLEHDVRIGPESIFEAGSVSKQFTAAAVLLLAREGKLSIDDPVRKYTDAFSGPQIDTVIFRRDSGGQVSAFSVVQDRVRDMRFMKQ